MIIEGVALFVILWFVIRLISLKVMFQQRGLPFKLTSENFFTSHIDPITDFLAVGFQLWLPASIVSSIYNYQPLLATCVIIMIALGIIAAYDMPEPEEGDS